MAMRIEFVDTSVHGPWPNMAEIEVSAPARQYLKDRRLPDA